MEEAVLVLSSKKRVKEGYNSGHNVALISLLSQTKILIMFKENQFISTAFVPPSPHLHSGQVVFYSCSFRTLSTVCDILLMWHHLLGCDRHNPATSRMQQVINYAVYKSSPGRFHHLFGLVMIIHSLSATLARAQNTHCI